MLKTLEHHEHAGHIAHGGAHGDGHGAGHDEAGTAGKLKASQLAALLVAVLAAGLAVTEQGAKHAEIKVQANLVGAADAWSQYQAKSTRGTLSQDLVRVIQAMDPATPDTADRRKQVIAALEMDQQRFENDPKDGKAAIAIRAHEFELARDRSLEETHSYHNGAAAMELGIVLATASAIIGSRMLILTSLAMGVLGGACALAGLFAPSWGAL